MSKLLIVSGLFGKKSSGSDELLPPPPPFPGIDALEKAKSAPKEDPVSNPKPKIDKKEQKRLEKERKKQEKLAKKELKKQQKEDLEKLYEPSPEEHREEPLVEPEEATQPIETVNDEPRKKGRHFLQKTGVLRTEEDQQMRDEHKEHFVDHKEFSNQVAEEERTKKGKGSFLGLFSKSRQKEEEQLSEIEANMDRLDDLSEHEDVAHDVGKTQDEIQDQEEIAEAIGTIQESEKPKGLFGRKKAPAPEPQLEQPEVMPTVDENVDVVEHIEDQIHLARLALMDFKFDQAKELYVQIMQEYNQLESEKKHYVYEDIKDLYYERKSAEKYGAV